MEHTMYMDVLIVNNAGTTNKIGLSATRLMTFTQRTWLVGE